jgi:hypothetical protein
MIRRALATAALLTALVSVPRPADASIILGGSLFVQGNQDVIVEYLGDFAGFTSGLFLADPLNAFGYLFINNGVQGSPGDQVNLGTFPIGTELIFGLAVDSTGDLSVDNTYYTGSGALNPDQIPHAQLYTDPLVDIGPAILAATLPTWAPGDGIIVGFEDIFGGGDFDYNDLIFSFQNLDVRQVPEPMTLTLFGLGAAGLVARSRRRTRSAK